MLTGLLAERPHLNQMLGLLVLLLATGVLFCLVSYSPADPSFNVATSDSNASNWMGLPGAFSADLLLQTLGLSGFLIPVWLGFSAWLRISNRALDGMRRRLCGGILLGVVTCCGLHLAAKPIEALMPTRWEATVRAGGALGMLLTDGLISVLNLGGTILTLLAVTAVGGYMVTSLPFVQILGRHEGSEPAGSPEESETLPIAEPSKSESLVPVKVRVDAPSALDRAFPAKRSGREKRQWGTVSNQRAPSRSASSTGALKRPTPGRSSKRRTEFGDKPSRTQPATDSSGSHLKLPKPSLLDARISREPYEEAQLQETAQQIVRKYAEFGIRGRVDQINPGPVVTTFEFKPDRGVRYSRTTALAEDLCLALECESLLVERIAGKSTVGIEVPNRKREVISFRQVVESSSFSDSKSMLTFALGKDINGGIHCADLATMPHLLVAGQTGSGKSVMLNCVIMSLLLRATPDQVRLILVDPKTVELGLYRDVPHLLTPVITDMKKAANAFSNAIVEMQRRLHLLARFGVRNIAQYNAKVERERAEESNKGQEEELETLPYIVIIVDELADMMITARRQVEESIQRLAQMARAVGIHLLLATQRPSVDVITGLIKANIPARLSFLLATRVDSRTILDSMGAESLLGKGDMLFLPPGTARRRRLHGPLVVEDEIRAVVSHWKSQAMPDYENAYLSAPDGDDGEASDGEPGLDDPMYAKAVKLVLEMGKASTSTLQRRLRLGYGRAARILDAMESEGIIGPPDGSRPRKVLKSPDWLDQVDSQDE